MPPRDAARKPSRRATRGRERSSGTAPTKVTVADVARRAGVSVGTVSNVLNGRESVSETRRTEVLSAIRDLGFTQNLLAKGMRLQRSNVVGLCMPYASYANFSALVDTIEQCLSNNKYQLMQVLSRQDPEKEFARVEHLVAHKIGGLLLVPSLKPKAILDFLHERNLPTVLINRTVAEDRRFDQVSVDHRAVMFRLTGELLARGYASVILAVQYPALSVTRQRTKGMVEAAAARSAAVRVLECGEERAAFLPRLEAALKDSPKPAVLVASNSGIASWAIQGFTQAGIRYPQDVSLVTLDDPEWAEIARPTLSVVRQPTQTIVQTAWELLAARINGANPAPRRVLLDAEFIFRDSVSR
jgi:LacI family transcriptional regulator